MIVLDTRKVAAEYRLSQWVNVIKDQKNSGQKIADYCQMKGISKNAFFYWQRKIRKAACVELIKQDVQSSNAPEGWLQLAPVDSKDAKLDIGINGCNVIVDFKTDPELLKKVCRILRTL